MGASSPIVLTMSAWAGSRHAPALRAALAFVYVCTGLIVLVTLLAVLSEGGTGVSWLSAVLVGATALVAVFLLRIARGMHLHLHEIRSAGRQGTVEVFADHCRIRFPGVLTGDLVLPADEIGAVCVDDRRPVWAALYWCRFLVRSRTSAGGYGGYVGCLFRPHLPNALQLLAPTPGVPNVAVLFTRSLSLTEAAGLGQAGESLAVLAAQMDDIETAADLPGARPLDPRRSHPGILLKVDSASAARQAFASWPAARERLEEADVRLLRPTPMPGAARKLAGVVGFVWMVAALGVTAFAVIGRSWSLVVPAVLLPLAIGGLAYETFRSLRGLQRPRAAAATVGAVGLMVATVVVGIFEIRDVATFDDPPPERPPTSFYIPEDPFPSDPPDIQIPSQDEPFDPLRPSE